MCQVGRWLLNDADVTKACVRARQMAIHAGRGVYVVVDAEGTLHTFLALHKPAREVLAIVGETDAGSTDVVWMAEMTA